MNAFVHPQIPNDKELLFQVAMTMIPQVGAVTARTLLSYCGSPSAVFESSRNALLKIPGIGPIIANQIGSKEILDDAEKECAFLETHHINPIFFTSPEYPRRLKHLPDAPILLYSKGTAKLNAPRTVAVIGTRSPSDYGKMMTDQLVEGLKTFDVHIISGLAYGIDIQAHRACLKVHVPTTGVLGSGFRHIYPASHSAVAQQMAEYGSLITEFHSQTKPVRENFPMRNRIIAGLSDAVVVVETAARGGSIITAELANGYHKDVFAVPGSANLIRSKGCNRLIKLHKAALVENADDIAYIMGWDQQNKNGPIQQVLRLDLPEKEEHLLRILDEHPSSNLDFIAHQLNTTPGNLAEHLLQLEIKGLVKSLPGNRYIASGTC